MTRADLTPQEFDPYYSKYINLLPENVELRESFEQGKERVSAFFNAIPEESLNFRYASGKWTIKEVLQHLIDTERILMYRAFRIARNDKTALASFDEGSYNQYSGARDKSRAQLIEEYEITRLYSLSILNSLTDNDLRNIGVSSMVPMSARAAAFNITGHEIWHCNTINEKYLNNGI